jgi:hypothetical protein
VWQRPWEWCGQMWQAVEGGCVWKWPWEAAVSIGCGKRPWKGLAVAVQRSGKGRGGPLRGQVTLIWHNFCLGNAYPMICKRFANAELTLIQGFLIPIVPTFFLPHVIDELTIRAFGTALAIARPALTLDLQLVGGSAP